MSCFSCCDDDPLKKAADSGSSYPPNVIANHQRNEGAYRPTEAAPKGAQTVKLQPILVPALSVDELKEITDNIGAKALIGEGSYGRVYLGVLKSGQAAAMKKLDASKQARPRISCSGFNGLKA